MAALHGRQDPLLDAPRFARFLRQANDAEVADVRKVGDDEYEISPHRSGGIQTPPPASAPPAARPAITRAGRDRIGSRRHDGRNGRDHSGEWPASWRAIPSRLAFTNPSR